MFLGSLRNEGNLAQSLARGDRQSEKGMFMLFVFASVSTTINDRIYYFHFKRNLLEE
jgi:hypothetical protein